MRSCDINRKVLFHHYSRDKKGTQKLAALVYVYINSISILPCISDGKRKMIYVLIILNMGTQLFKRYKQILHRTLLHLLRGHYMVSAL